MLITVLDIKEGNIMHFVESETKLVCTSKVSYFKSLFYKKKLEKDGMFHLNFHGKINQVVGILDFELAELRSKIRETNNIYLEI